MVHELKKSLSCDEEVILKDFHNKRRIETQKTNQISALINELTGERTHQTEYTINFSDQKKACWRLRNWMCVCQLLWPI